MYHLKAVVFAVCVALCAGQLQPEKFTNTLQNVLQARGTGNANNPTLGQGDDTDDDRLWLTLLNNARNRPTPNSGNQLLNTLLSVARQEARNQMTAITNFLNNPIPLNNMMPLNDD